MMALPSDDFLMAAFTKREPHFLRGPGRQ
jgi:hypothetical protein